MFWIYLLAESMNSSYDWLTDETGKGIRFIDGGGRHWVCRLYLYVNSSMQLKLNSKYLRGLLFPGQDIWGGFATNYLNLLRKFRGNWNYSRKRNKLYKYVHNGPTHVNLSFLVNPSLNLLNITVVWTLRELVLRSVQLNRAFPFSSALLCVVFWLFEIRRSVNQLEFLLFTTSQEAQDVHHH